MAKLFSDQNTKNAGKKGIGKIIYSSYYLQNVNSILMFLFYFGEKN
jgi:hypothetical protein